MTSSHFICHVLSVYCLLIHRLVTGFNIDCSTTQCHNAFINCLPSEDCFVSCSEPQECAGSIINCPVSGDCDIQCLGEQSCFDTTIDATLSAGSLSVLCGDEHSQFEDHCNTIKIFGSTLYQNTDDIHIKCNGNCKDADINCPFYGNCHVFCDGNSSCKYSHITGPIHGHLDINCNAQASCANAIFNGAASSTLDITGCQAYQSCLDLTIYCPPHTNGAINCFIEGNDNLGRSTQTLAPVISPTTTPTETTPIPTTTTSTPTTTPTMEPLSSPVMKSGDGILIYAVNGWKDILVNYTGTFSEGHVGKMFCGNTYDVSCNLAADEWSCGDMYHDCSATNVENIYKASTTTQTTIVFQEVDVQNKDVSKLSEHGSPSVDYPYVASKGSDGDLFILVCVMCVVLTCIGVGFAQMRKNMLDQQKARTIDPYGTNIHKRSASFRRQRSLSSKARSNALYRHQRSQSDKPPKEMHAVLI